MFSSPPLLLLYSLSFGFTNALLLLLLLELEMIPSISYGWRGSLVDRSPQKPYLYIDSVFKTPSDLNEACSTL